VSAGNPYFKKVKGPRTVESVGKKVSKFGVETVFKRYLERQGEQSVSAIRREAVRSLEHFKPPPKVSVSEWADQKRILTSKDSPDIGKWVTDKAPYQREMMDVLGDLFVEQVVLMCGSQTGKTAGSVLNTLGYYIDLDPCPILLVYPTVTDAEKVSRQRVAPMIEACPSLRRRIEKYSRDPETGDTLLMKNFPGGTLIIGGADRPNSLANFPIRILLLDEIDRYKASAGQEGDPVQLAITRTSNYWNRKIVLSSTPTSRQSSRIFFAFEHSSQGRWNLQCPGCFQYQQLLWDQIDYSTVPGKILATCRYCSQGHTKAKWLSQKGAWIHQFPENKVRGYHVNSIVSPWLSWETLVEEWIKASDAAKRGNDNLRKVFINTRLAEVWEENVIRIHTHKLYERREFYGIEEFDIVSNHSKDSSSGVGETKEPYEIEVPDGVYLLTCGVDVQDVQKRIHYEVVGWGKGYESWGIEYGVLMFDPYEPEWWKLMDDLVYNRLFRCSGDRYMRVRKALFDSNGAVGPSIYAYTRKRQPRFYAIKGSPHEKPIAGAFTESYRLDLKYNTMWYPVNTNMAKDELFHKLLIGTPGIGYCHFPCGLDQDMPIRGYDNDYFEGLTSETKKEIVDKWGFTRFKYSKEGATRTSNEPLDCRIYARAALELAEQRGALERMAEPDYVKDAKTTANPTIFTPNSFKNTQKSAKIEQIDEEFNIYREIQEETGKKFTGPTKGLFGQFGATKSNLDLFSDEY
jgi:phage terminase large subunit GpA-like protein